MIDQIIETAWDEYRGWAKRARALQSSSQNWNKIALYCAVAAAILGAAATQASGDPPLGQALSLAAAVAAALVPVLGREILSLGGEAKYIRARATAEAIKSECYRLAAAAGDYAGTDAASKFSRRLEALTDEAIKAAIAPLADPVVDKGDRRRPSTPLDVEWYKSNRIDDQIKFFTTGQIKHEEAVTRLRYLSVGASVLAAAFGAAGAIDPEMFAPWIAALTTIATTVAAYGLMERRQYLAASYGAMATSLGRIKGIAGSLSAKDFVAQAEDLLQSEHAAWTERMTKTIPAPPAAARTRS
jgi:hypothetical protein